MKLGMAIEFRDDWGEVLTWKSVRKSSLEKKKLRFWGIDIIVAQDWQSVDLSQNVIICYTFIYFIQVSCFNWLNSDHHFHFYSEYPNSLNSSFFPLGMSKVHLRSNLLIWGSYDYPLIAHSLQESLQSSHESFWGILLINLIVEQEGHLDLPFK